MAALYFCIVRLPKAEERKDEAKNVDQVEFATSPMDNKGSRGTEVPMQNGVGSIEEQNSLMPAVPEPSGDVDTQDAGEAEQTATTAVPPSFLKSSKFWVVGSGCTCAFWTYSACLQQLMPGMAQRLSPDSTKTLITTFLAIGKMFHSNNLL